MAEKPEPSVPFAYADWTWLNGNPRNKDAALDSKFFTPEIRMDVHYIYDFNHPIDDYHGRLERNLSVQRNPVRANRLWRRLPLATMSAPAHDPVWRCIRRHHAAQ